jgi:hypothetical protein
MNNKLLNILAIFTLIILGVALPTVKAQVPPSVLFTPTTTTVVQNGTATLTITINTNTTAVRASDITILYAANDLEFVSAENGNFFPSFNYANDTANGRLELHGYTSYIGDSRNGTSTYATIFFKAKKSSGSSTISFVCSGSGHDTDIVTTTGQNILSCTQLNQVAVTYTGESTPTNTPTPTLPPGVTTTPTPTPTPNQGSSNTIPTCTVLSTSTSFAVGTPLAVTFTCSGVDPGGYINAAEFIFGDGTKDTIIKNVGSPGSISTTHTYTTIGSLGASCRVRDNDNVFSYNSYACQRIIVINPKPVAAAATSYYQRVIAPEIVYTDPVLTPTPPVVALVYETPMPEAPIVIPTVPTVPEAPAKSAPSYTLWWILGIIAVIVGVILLRRKKEPPPPPPTTSIPPQPPTPPTAPPSV